MSKEVLHAGVLIVGAGPAGLGVAAALKRAGDIDTIDTMVTVVDAPNFLRDYATTEQLVDRGQAVGEEDERTMS